MDFRVHHNLSYHEIVDVLRCGNFCRLSVSEDNQPYTLPMRYTFREVDETCIFRLIGECETLPLESLTDNNKVCIEVERMTPDGLLTIVVLGRARIRTTDGVRIIIVTSRELYGRVCCTCAGCLGNVLGTCGCEDACGCKECLSCNDACAETLGDCACAGALLNGCGCRRRRRKNCNGNDEIWQPWPLNGCGCGCTNC